VREDFGVNYKVDNYLKGPEKETRAIYFMSRESQDTSQGKENSRHSVKD